MATHNIASHADATNPYARLLINVALRLLSLALGSAFGLLTARVLLWDVHSFEGLTVEHYLTAGALCGAIAAGVGCGPVLRAGKLWIAMALLFGAMAATGYCLIGSAGRADELAFERNAMARQVNKDRDRAKRNRDEAQKRYETALEAETAECSRGAGPRCLGRRATTQERRSDLEVSELLLQRAKPEQRENGKLKRAAQIIALVSGRSELGAERALSIVWPFLPPSICELLTIAFLHLAFAPWKRRRVAVIVAPIVPAIEKPRETVATVDATVESGWVPMSVAQARELARKARAEDLFQELRSARNPLCNDELAKRLNINKGECSRRVTALKEAGLLHRMPVGRYVAISLRPLMH